MAAAKAKKVKRIYFKGTQMLVVCPWCDNEEVPSLWFVAHVGTCRLTGTCSFCHEHIDIPKRVVVERG